MKLLREEKWNSGERAASARCSSVVMKKELSHDVDQPKSRPPFSHSLYMQIQSASLAARPRGAKMLSLRMQFHEE